MVQVLNILKIAAVLVPVLLELIKAVETSGAGDLKKQAVMDIVSKILTELTKQGLTIPVTLILNVVNVAIDAIVAGFNLVGIFKKQPAA